jgi:hypothetical protein
MTYQQARMKMVQGKKIKLPEWDYYAMKEGVHIKCFDLMKDTFIPHLKPPFSTYRKDYILVE